MTLYSTPLVGDAIASYTWVAHDALQAKIGGLSAYEYSKRMAICSTCTLLQAVIYTDSQMNHRLIVSHAQTLDLCHGSPSSLGM